MPELEGCKILGDARDVAIIDLLRLDPRRSYSGIADEVGLSGEAVKSRIEKLTATGQVDILGVTDPSALGYNVVSNVAIQYAGDIDEFASIFRSHDCVTFLASTIGRTNLLCEIATEDDAQLSKFISEHVAQDPGIRTIEVSRVTRVLRWGGYGETNNIVPTKPVKPGSLDDHDVAILRVLLRNPRVRITELASHLGLPYALVRRKTASLFRNEVIRAVAITERMMPGKHAVALVHANVHSDEQLLRAIADEPRITIAIRVIGGHSAELEIVSNTAEELSDIIDKLQAAGLHIQETILLARSLILPISWRFHNTVEARYRTLTNASCSSSGRCERSR